MLNKRCNEIVTPFIKHIKITGQISGDDFSVFEKFIKNLRNIRIEFFQKPTEAVLKLLPSIRINTLRLHEIDAQGIQGLMCNLPHNIRGLDLRSNGIGYVGVQALAENLPPTLQQLYLSGNNIGDAGMQALAENLPPTLQQLYLSGNNIGDAGMQALAKKLPATLQKLYLSGNNIGDAGMQALAKKLPATLQQLCMGWSDIGDAGAQALAENIPPNLQVLWLNSNNKILDTGLRALAKKFPLALREFYFRNFKITDEGWTALLGAIPRTSLEKVTTSEPKDSSLCEQFKNLRNQQGHPVTVNFE
ncbi:MAG: hypothetical protein ACRCYZ_02255 [Alphaproteobacteria bacterium]